MAVIVNKLWNGEPLKCVLHFASGDYTVYNDIEYNIEAETESLLRDVSFRLSEGNSSVNPLGVAASNSVSFKIYDADDELSPMNINSTYYGEIVNGVKVNFYISYDGSTWDDYGIYYLTSVSGSYSDGGHDLVNFTAEDKLNTIGNLDLPDIPAYSNVEAGVLISSVMAGLGLDPSEYVIDSRIDQTMKYGIVSGTKVREFFNNICQLLLARVVIDRHGIIHFVPAIGIYTDGNEITVTPDETGTFINKNNSNIDYNRLIVKYLEAGDISRGQILKDSTHSLNIGNNKITDIRFKQRVLAIEQVSVLFNNDTNNPRIDAVNYKGYQQGMELDIDVSNASIPECTIVGYGIIVSTTDRVITKNIDQSTVIGGRAFEFDTKQMMAAEDAENIADNLQSYLGVISRNVLIKGSALTPMLNVGDKVTISNTDTLYDGVYKIVDMTINISENYSLDATLIRIGTVEEV